MATRSTIAILREDGSVAKIYCHWDGYLENNGRILLEHYDTAEKVEQLIALGDLSSLGKTIGSKHPFNTFDQSSLTAEDIVIAERARAENMCTAYGRDRGEADTQAKVYHSLVSYENLVEFEEYNYVFMHGEWAVMADYNVPAAGLTKGVPVLLRDAMTRIDAAEKNLLAA